MQGRHSSEQQENPIVEKTVIYIYIRPVEPLYNGPVPPSLFGAHVVRNILFWNHSVLEPFHFKSIPRVSTLDQGPFCHGASSRSANAIAQGE